MREVLLDYRNSSSSVVRHSLDTGRTPFEDGQSVSELHDAAFSGNRLVGTPLDFLTGREREILGLLCDGRTGREISRALSLQPSTVRSHVQSLLTKLQVHSRLEAISVAAKYGMRPRAIPRSLAQDDLAPGDEDATGDVPPQIEVVLVEPREVFRQAARDRLNRDRRIHVVASVSHPEAALQALALAPAHVVILAGIDDPQELATIASRIRESVDSCRIIVVGRSDDTATLLRLFEIGARGYVSAHDPIDRLVKATKIVSRGQVAIPRSLHEPLVHYLLEQRLVQLTGQSLLEPLTKREREVLELLVEGKSNDAVARKLMVSVDTARTHVQNILQKLGVHSRVAAVAIALNGGLLQRDPR
jgi:DNA-binding NarL/FixJ family response regulator